MNRLAKKLSKSILRKNRVRSVVKGTAVRPRLCVHVSNLHISAQLIDDENSITIAGYSTTGKKLTGTMTQKAVIVGVEIAKKAKAKKINAVVFDRGPKKYHGRVKALADAARKEGLEF